MFTIVDGNYAEIHIGTAYCYVSKIAFLVPFTLEAFINGLEHNKNIAFEFEDEEIQYSIAIYQDHTTLGKAYVSSSIGDHHYAYVNVDRIELAIELYHDFHSQEWEWIDWQYNDKNRYVRLKPFKKELEKLKELILTSPDFVGRDFDDEIKFYLQRREADGFNGKYITGYRLPY